MQSWTLGAIAVNDFGKTPQFAVLALEFSVVEQDAHTPRKQDYFIRTKHPWGKVMPKAARVTDRHKAVSSPGEYLALLKGEDDESATEEILTGSHNVFINGLPAATVGDECEAGATYIATGCANVFINGRSVARITDLTCHQTTIVTGSKNVFIGSANRPPASLGMTAEAIQSAFEE